MRIEEELNKSQYDSQNTDSLGMGGTQSSGLFDVAEKEVSMAKVRKRSKFRQLMYFLVLVLFIFLVSIIYFMLKDTSTWVMNSAGTDGRYRSRVVSDPMPLSATNSSKPVNIEQPCYGLTIPYGVKKISQRDPCSIFVSLQDPRGSVTVDLRTKEAGSESMHVSMRRAFPSKYQESQLTVNDFRYTVFTNLEVEGYEKTAFLEKDSAWIGITLKTEISQESRDDELKSILNTFYCKSNCSL